MSTCLITPISHADTSVSSKDHNILPDAQNQYMPYGQTQPLPRKIIPHVCQTLFRLHLVYLLHLSSLSPHLCQLHLSDKSMTQLHEFVSKLSKSFSPSFHTQLNQTSLLVNDHPMLTRVKTGKSEPKVFLVHSEPTTTMKALAQPKWFQVMKNEYASLINNGTWVMKTIPPYRNTIGCK